MSRRVSSTVGMLVGTLLLSACASPLREPAPPSSGVDAPVASAADPAGRMSGFQFARRHQDVVRVEGELVQQVVEYGFDYDRRQTVRRIYSPDGALGSEELLGAESLQANPAEEKRMNELVRTHPVLGPMMEAPDLTVHSGGFVLRESGDPHCDHGSRCIRYIVSRGPDFSPYIHAVVDLVTDRVVYPDYDTRQLAGKAQQEPYK